MTNTTLYSFGTVSVNFVCLKATLLKYHFRNIAVKIFSTVSVFFLP